MVIHDDIAIIGISGRYPAGANSPYLLWDLLLAGKDAISEVRSDRWDLSWHHPEENRPSRIYTSAGGFLDNVDKFDGGVLRFVSPRGPTSGSAASVAAGTGLGGT